MNHQSHTPAGADDPVTIATLLIGLLWLVWFGLLLSRRLRDRKDRATSLKAVGTIEYKQMFRCGVIGCSIGVLLHIPMFLAAAEHNYRMVGMPTGTPMLVAMFLIVAGFIAGVIGLLPADSSRLAEAARDVRVAAMDDAPLSWAHVALVVAIAFAVTIDLMKTTTLSLVTPGMVQEYGLSTATHQTTGPSAAWIGFAGVTGTVAGAYIWGLLADRLGRRSSILLAGLGFVATSICGVMPSYLGNLIMCFIMGLFAGGMLPIAFAILVEVIPARHRGWVMVLVCSNVTGAIVLTSWLSAVLTPHFGWRILWLIGMPTGLILLLLNRLIPESPRFLMAQNKPEAAAQIMQKFHVGVTAPSDNEVSDPPTDRRPIVWLPMIAVMSLGASVGVLTFGFQFWLPINLQTSGYTDKEVALILRDAAGWGLPTTAIVAAGYGLWSSRWTLTILAFLTAGSVLMIAVVPTEMFGSRPLTTALLVLPIAGTSSMGALVVVNAAELAHTGGRGRLSGLAASATKAGGWLMTAWGLIGLATLSMTTLALLGGVLLAIAATIYAASAPETRGRNLESIQGDLAPKQDADQAHSPTQPSPAIDFQERASNQHSSPAIRNYDG